MTSRIIIMNQVVNIILGQKDIMIKEIIKLI